MIAEFQLDRIEGTPDGWALTAPAVGLRIEFRAHLFNETQAVTFADEDAFIRRFGPQGVARILREAGDWISSHAYAIAMPVPENLYRGGGRGNE